jgi:hypothetical protein
VPEIERQIRLLSHDPVELQRLLLRFSRRGPLTQPVEHFHEPDKRSREGLDPSSEKSVQSPV